MERVVPNFSYLGVKKLFLLENRKQLSLSLSQKSGFLGPEKTTREGRVYDKHLV
jgi:hypothetical protein